MDRIKPEPWPIYEDKDWTVRVSTAANVSKLADIISNTAFMHKRCDLTIVGQCPAWQTLKSLAILDRRRERGAQELFVQRVFQANFHLRSGLKISNVPPYFSLNQAVSVDGQVCYTTKEYTSTDTDCELLFPDGTKRVLNRSMFSPLLSGVVIMITVIAPISED